MTKKTKLEILKETFEYYSSDPSRRGINPMGGYVYKADDGRMCAIGMKMITPELYESTIDKLEIIKEQVLVEDIDHCFKEEYRGHDVLFWRELQIWHDYDCNFTKTGLSNLGQESCDRLIKKYSDEN